MAAVNEIPPNGWPLLPPQLVPEPEPAPEPTESCEPDRAPTESSAVTPEPEKPAEPEIPVDDLASVVASLNTRSERVYVDRRPTAA